MKPDTIIIMTIEDSCLLQKEKKEFMFLLFCDVPPKIKQIRQVFDFDNESFALQQLNNEVNPRSKTRLRTKSLSCQSVGISLQATRLFVDDISIKFTALNVSKNPLATRTPKGQ